jgi:lysophospholipase L1-like esterase
MVVLAALVGLAAHAPDVDARKGRSLLVVGDSVAVGTRPYVRRFLRGWRVVQRTTVSMQAAEGPRVMRRLGRLPRVVFVNLGTNGSPGAVGYFRSALRRTMRVAGRRRCVVWATVKRPPVGGTSYRGLNRVLVRQARRRPNLILFPWLRMARRHPSWFSDDGVHVTAAAYRIRARAMARKIRECRRITRRRQRSQ